MTGSPKEVIVSQEEPPEIEVEIENEMSLEIQEGVSLSALSGNANGVNIILVYGIVKKRALSILVDSGSTNSFINEVTVKETGYQSI